MFPVGIETEMTEETEVEGTEIEVNGQTEMTATTEMIEMQNKRRKEIMKMKKKCTKEREWKGR